MSTCHVPRPMPGANGMPLLALARERPLCMSRRASPLPPLGPISHSSRSPAGEGSRRTRAPAQVGRAWLCLGWARRERPFLRSPIRASPGARTAHASGSAPLGAFPLLRPRPPARSQHTCGGRPQMATLWQVCAAGPCSLRPLHLKIALRALGRSKAAPGDTPAPAPGPPAARAYSSRGSRGVGRTEGLSAELLKVCSAALAFHSVHSEFFP